MPEEIPEVDCLPEVLIGEKAAITGRWQLLTAYGGYKGVWPNEELDFSCDKVIYEFFPDGTLKVTSTVGRFPQDDYIYEFTGNLVSYLFPDGMVTDPCCNLQIDGMSADCTVMKSVMAISTHTDGLFFVRIE
jgi:hypothetical protein